jgi:hypothetical protein
MKNGENNAFPIEIFYEKNLQKLQSLSLLTTDFRKECGSPTPFELKACVEENFVEGVHDQPIEDMEITRGYALYAKCSATYFYECKRRLYEEFQQKLN